MKATITEYRELAADGQGRTLPMGQGRIAVQSQTAAGAFAALNGNTRFIRLATDTAVTLDVNGSAVDELFLAGVEFIAVAGGEILTTALA